MQNKTSKFLIDTGSPYSIMSNKIFNKFAKENNWQTKADKTRLRAADGNIIKTYGRFCISLTVEGKWFNQEFIIAKIQGMDGIIGMDFLYKVDGTINIKKQILRTKKGKLSLFKQTSNTSAHIQIAENPVFPPNSELSMKGKIEQSCMNLEAISISEQTHFLAKRGCFTVRNLVNQKNKRYCYASKSLSEEAAKVKQNSVIGSLQQEEHVYNTYTDKVTTQESDTEDKIARWLSIIETYDYKPRYRPGLLHLNADCYQ